MRFAVSFVYILASQRNGTLYIGVTANLAKRDVRKGFTSKYGVHTLVWYEVHNDIREAIDREKRIKRWNRAWKLALIEKENPPVGRFASEAAGGAEPVTPGSP